MDISEGWARCHQQELQCPRCKAVEIDTWSPETTWRMEELGILDHVRGSCWQCPQCRTYTLPHVLSSAFVPVPDDPRPITRTSVRYEEEW